MLTTDDVIGRRYKILRPMGQGSVTTLFHAYDAEEGREVALKVLWSHLRKNALVAARFRREAAIARRLNHPNVVPIFDLLDEPEALCLVMEYVDGHDLRREIRNQGGTLSVSRATQIGCQVLDALQAAHSHGIIHRDLKPQNILIASDGRALLTDFGVARVSDMVGLTTHTMVMGSPEYAAPEQLSDPFVDGRADLYSLGAILYEAVSSRPPFDARAPLEVLRQRRNLRPLPLTEIADHVPDDFAAAIDRALAREPHDRFATAEAMVEALRGSRATLLPRRGVSLDSICPFCRAPKIEDFELCIDCGGGPLVVPEEGGKKVLIMPKRFDTTWERDNSGTFIIKALRQLIGALMEERESPMRGAEKEAVLTCLRHAGWKLAPDHEGLTAYAPFVLAQGLDDFSARRLADFVGQSQIVTIANRSASDMTVEEVRWNPLGLIQPLPHHGDGDFRPLPLESYRFPIDLSPGEVATFCVPQEPGASPFGEEHLQLRPQPPAGVEIYVQAPLSTVERPLILADKPSNFPLSLSLVKSDQEIAASRKGAGSREIAGSRAPKDSGYGWLSWAMPLWSWRSYGWQKLFLGVLAVGNLAFLLFIVVTLPDQALGFTLALAAMVWGPQLGILALASTNAARNQRALAYHPRQRRQSASRGLAELVGEPFQRIHHRRTRQIARQLIVEGLSLQEALAADPGDEDSGQYVQRFVVHHVEEAARLEPFERAMAQIDPATLHRRIDRVQRRIEAASDEESLDKLRRKRSELFEKLDELDEAHRRITVSSARLLEAINTLSRWSDRLQNQGPTSDPVEEARRSIEDLQLEIQALQSLEEDQRFDYLNLIDVVSVGDEEIEVDWSVPPRFELLSQLGGGGMATVYRARDRVGDHEEVALKVLHPHLRANRAVVEQLRREVEVVQRLVHPGIAAVYEFVEADDVVFMVMEYCSGRDLNQRLQIEGRLPIDEVERLARPILKALSHAHGQGVVHGDIKPHNILLDADLAPRLADFGIARHDDQDLGDNLHVGTPEYVAPEVLSTPIVDGRADLYSVGVLLFQMLTGKLPFDANSPAALLEQKQSGSIPDVRELRPDVPEPLADAIGRALSADPEGRFDTAQEMLQALSGEFKTDEVGSAEVIEATHSCAVCASQIFDELKICLHCGHRTLPLRKKGRYGAYIWLPAPRRRGGKKQRHLSADQVAALGDVFRDRMGVELHKDFDLRVQALPAMLLTGLHHDDAPALIDEIEEVAGVQAESASLFTKFWLRKAPAQVLPSFLSFLPYLLLLPLLFYALASVSMMLVDLVATYWGFFGMGVITFAALSFLLFITACFFLYFLNDLWQARKPAIMLTSNAQSLSLRPPIWLDEVYAVHKKLPSRRLRQMLRRVVEQTVMLKRRNRRADHGEQIDEFLVQILPAFERLGSLEEEVLSHQGSSLRQNLGDVEKQIEASQATQDIADLIALREQILEQIADRDRKFRELTLLSGQVLDVLQTLDGLEPDVDSPIAMPEWRLDFGDDRDHRVSEKERAEAEIYA